MCTQLPFAHEEFAIEPGLCAVHKHPFRPLYVLQRDFDDLKRIAANREKFPRNEASMRIREIIKKMYR